MTAVTKWKSRVTSLVVREPIERNRFIPWAHRYKLNRNVICHKVSIQIAMTVRRKSAQQAIGILLALILVDFLAHFSLPVAIAIKILFLDFGVPLFGVHFLHVTVQVISEASGKVAMLTLVALDSHMHILVFL